MKKHKVIIDTNLLNAGNFNPGSSSYKILEQVVKGKLSHVWIEDIKKEHKYILSKISKKQGYLDFISSIYDSKYEIKNVSKVKLSEDPDDDKYLGCAKKANADYIIFSDDHLLSIKKYGKTQIFSPTTFLKRVNNKSKSVKYRVSSDFHGGKRKHPGRLV
ncbi:MAG: putative toxin-antitoxin system toxin component, PIN family [Patescibacteria group bacterium]